MNLKEKGKKIVEMLKENINKKDEIVLMDER